VERRQSALDDRELVARFLRDRDEVCFRALYRAHTAGLLLFAERFLGGARADAEDAVQEAWIRAVRLLPQFRWESSLRTWLTGIAINCCRELQRRRRPAEEWSDAAGGEALSSPPRPATDLETLLRALPPGYRQVLLLHDLEGHTHEEIAARLEISAGTSKSQLSRARALLRRWLDGAPRRAAAGKESP
jgi:RNA polymerase sigma-70 factor (ECF subfamily)